MKGNQSESSLLGLLLGPDWYLPLSWKVHLDVLFWNYLQLCVLIASPSSVPCKTSRLEFIPLSSLITSLQMLSVGHPEMAYQFCSDSLNNTGWKKTCHQAVCVFVLISSSSYSSHPWWIGIRFNSFVYWGLNLLSPRHCLSLGVCKAQGISAYMGARGRVASSWNSRTCTALFMGPPKYTAQGSRPDLTPLGMALLPYESYNKVL